MRVGHYSDYLVRVSGIVGVASGSLLAEEKTQFNGWFTKAADRIWDQFPWPVTTDVEQRTPNSDYVIALDQSGQSVIDTVFEVWNGNPYISRLPSRVPWTLTNDGIQLLGQTTVTGVWVYFRRQCPQFSGADYSASATYAVGDSMYYTNTAGKGNYYLCAVVTTAGQNPDSTPASWTRQELPYDFFEYVIHSAYADWLRSDGQNDKAAQADAYAMELQMTATEKVERQQRFVPQLIVQTHLTSRPLI